MLYILDTADLEAIRHCNEFYPLAGVTTNPSIIAKEKTDFWRLVGEIRAVIGGGKMLHVQTVQKTAEKMVEEAELLKARIGGELYIKIPIGRRRAQGHDGAEKTRHRGDDDGHLHPGTGPHRRESGRIVRRTVRQPIG